MVDWFDFIESVDNNEWPNFYKRAEENKEAMQEAFDKGRYYVAGSCASLCVIAICDAILVKRKGYKTKLDHRRIVDAMERAFGDKQDIRNILATLSAVIETKSAFQYNWNEVSEKEAGEAVSNAEIVFDYVVQELRLLEN
jgi:HEPN domain-containing protein